MSKKPKGEFWRRVAVRTLPAVLPSIIDPRISRRLNLLFCREVAKIFSADSCDALWVLVDEHSEEVTISGLSRLVIGDLGVAECLDSRNAIFTTHWQRRAKTATWFWHHINGALVIHFEVDPIS